MIDPQQNRGLRVLSYLAMAQHELGEAINEETTGSELARLDVALAAWSAKTQGGPALPLQQLTAKVLAMGNDRYNAVDYAECMLLVLDAAHRAGFGLNLLVEKGFEHLRNVQTVQQEIPALDWAA